MIIKMRKLTSHLLQGSGAERWPWSSLSARVRVCPRWADEITGEVLTPLRRKCGPRDAGSRRFLPFWLALTLKALLLVPQAGAVDSPQGIAAVSIAPGGALSFDLGAVLERQGGGTVQLVASMLTPPELLPLSGLGWGLTYRSAISDALDVFAGGGAMLLKFDPLRLEPYLELGGVYSQGDFHLRLSYRIQMPSGTARLSLGLELQTPYLPPSQDQGLPDLFGPLFNFDAAPLLPSPPEPPAVAAP